MESGKCRLTSCQREGGREGGEGGRREGERRERGREREREREREKKKKKSQAVWRQQKSWMNFLAHITDLKSELLQITCWLVAVSGLLMVDHVLHVSVQLRKTSLFHPSV